MLGNYLRVAGRSLFRRWPYTVIEVAGLAVSLAFVLPSLVYIQHEYSYDSFHTKADRLYRVGSELELAGERSGSDHTPPPLGPMLASDYPEVEGVVRLMSRSQYQLRVEDTKLPVRVVRADPQLFDLLDFPVVEGDAAGALLRPDALVLSRTGASRLFGDESPMGRSATLSGEGRTADCTVAAIVEVPGNSSIQFDVLTSLSPMLRGAQADSWGWNALSTYALLRPDTDLERLGAASGQAALERRLEHMTQAAATRSGGSQRRAMKKVAALGQASLRTDFQPITQLHVDDGVRRMCSILGLISVAVLLVACINFTNLSLALSTHRLREVGLRKALGARRGQVAAQLWGEAGLVSVASLVLGLALAEVVLPVYGGLLGVELTMSYAAIWPWVVVLVLVVALLSGGYPAAVASGFVPAHLFRRDLGITGVGLVGRGLVVAQLGLAVFFVTAALTMRAQMLHLGRHDLGYDEESIAVIHLGFGRLEQEQRGRMLEAYRHVAAQQPRIQQVSGANATLAGMPGSIGPIATPAGSSFDTYYFHADGNFLRTTGIELVAGPGPSAEQVQDGGEGLLVNEAFARALGRDDVVGMRLDGEGVDGNLRGRQVTGVVGDFNNLSLHQQVAPVAILCTKGSGSYPYVFVRCAPGSLAEVVTVLRQAWEELLPGEPFEYSFLEEDVAAQYRREQRWQQIVDYSAVLAVLVACVGAFGLTSLAVARRTREVGIRKVLGGSGPRIAALLLRDFGVLAGVGALLAAPASHYVLDGWLNGFAYRMEMNPVLLLAGGLMTLALVVGSVCYQCVRAALLNPVDILRYE